jgi:glutathione synthase/RimK-type ligase-like ATP-grasp enzyme
VSCANLVGNGLYGVDLKELDSGVYVIEINDNPNIDAGTEDAVLGDELYRKVLGHLLRQFEAPFEESSPSHDAADSPSVLALAG